MTKFNFLKTACVLCLMALFSLSINAQNRTMIGDVDGSTAVDINDVTVLINYVLTGDETGVDLAAADIAIDGSVDINDVTALINYVLTGEMPYTLPEPIEFTVSGITFQMQLVEGGTFTMGGQEGYPHLRPWELPAHEVTLSDYYIGVTEVTQELYKAVVGSNPSWFTSTNGYTNNLKRPVENITFANAQNFITKLNQKTGKTFRLITEAEWEYAARGGRLSKGYMFPGSDNVDEVAWHSGNSQDLTYPVGQKLPNELGLYDMGGNVEEWCADWYGEYSARPATNPTGPTTGTTRVVRGASWNQAWYTCRPSSRHDGGIPTYAHARRGLRIAMTPQ